MGRLPARGHGPGRRRRALGGAAPGLHRGPVLGVLPPLRGLAGTAGTRPRSARATRVARPGGARPSPAPGRGTRRAPVPRPGGDGGSPGRGARARRRRVARAVPAVGHDRRRGAAHALHDVPAGPRPHRTAARDRHRRSAAPRPVPPAAGEADGRGTVRGRRCPLVARGQRCACGRAGRRTGQRGLRLAAGDARPEARVPRAGRGRGRADGGTGAARPDSRSGGALRTAGGADRRARRPGRRRAHLGRADRAGCAAP